MTKPRALPLATFGRFRSILRTRKSTKNDPHKKFLFHYRREKGPETD